MKARLGRGRSLFVSVVAAYNKLIDQLSSRPGYLV